MSTAFLTPQVKKVREIVESLGPPIDYRKLHGIVNALMMQVEDGCYDDDAVTLLCQALLASAETYEIPGATFDRLEAAACIVVTLVEDRRQELDKWSREQ